MVLIVYIYIQFHHNSHSSFSPFVFWKIENEDRKRAGKDSKWLLNKLAAILDAALRTARQTVVSHSHRKNNAKLLWFEHLQTWPASPFNQWSTPNRYRQVHRTSGRPSWHMGRCRLGQWRSQTRRVIEWSPLLRSKVSTFWVIRSGPEFDFGHFVYRGSLYQIQGPTNSRRWGYVCFFLGFSLCNYHF